MASADATIVSTEKFQKAFIYFYKVRFLEKEFYSEYFKILQQSLLSKTEPQFGDVLEKLYIKSNRWEKSFASKLVATINPNKPIIDNNLLKSLNLHLKVVNKYSCIGLYENVEKYIQNILSSKDGKVLIDCFNQYLTDYFPCDQNLQEKISDVKKIDFILWIYGSK